MFILFNLCGFQSERDFESGLVEESLRDQLLSFSINTCKQCVVEISSLHDVKTWFRVQLLHAIIVQFLQGC